MNLVTDTMYKVKNNHPYHPNRIGRFRFLGGPQQDAIVLSDTENDNEMFAVGLNDLVDFDPTKDEVVNVNWRHQDVNAERIYQNDKCLGIIHEKNGNWYVTMPLQKNINLPTFRTCGNGIVRLPARPNHCSDAMTWRNKEEAILFLQNYHFMLEKINETLGNPRPDNDP